LAFSLDLDFDLFFFPAVSDYKQTGKKRKWVFGKLIKLIGTQIFADKDPKIEVLRERSEG